MSIFEAVAAPFLKRENERLAAQAESAQAQLDYVYMMSGIEPLEDEEETHGDEEDAE